MIRNLIEARTMAERKRARVKRLSIKRQYVRDSHGKFARTSGIAKQVAQKVVGPRQNVVDRLIKAAHGVYIKGNVILGDALVHSSPFARQQAMATGTMSPAISEYAVRAFKHHMARGR